MSDKLTKNEVKDTIAFLTLGIKLCSTTTKNDRITAEKYTNDTFPRVLRTLLESISDE